MEIHIEMLSAADIWQYIPGRHEVELVDTLLRLREDLVSKSICYRYTECSC